jgi:LuxR family maltose regulon positive regulatory protein
VESLLDQGTAGRLTVISAGPGWGKTTAVTQWLQARRDRWPHVAWLTLESADDSPAAFVASLLGATRSSGAFDDDHPMHGLSLASGRTEELLRALSAALRDQAGSPMLLVLDDTQVLHDTDVLHLLSMVIGLSPRLRVVLVGRVDPPIPLSALRLSGELTEIVAEDLAMVDDELRAVAAADQVPLSDEDVRLIRRKTEGWPVGARLATLYLARRRGDIAGFVGSERSVAEYLLAEVLAGLPDSTGRFLQATSVVRRVNADLANAITGTEQGQALLEELTRSNLFVTALGVDQTWFRYHPLLRDLLQHSLRRDDPARYRAAHANAARWYLTHGEPLHALEHSRVAEQWSLFGEVFVVAASGQFVGIHREALARNLRTVPINAIPDCSWLRLVLVGLAYLDANLEGTAHDLAAARRLLPLTTRRLRPPTELLITLFEAALARAVGDMQAQLIAAHAAQRILQREAGPFPARDDYAAVTSNALGVGLLWAGDLTAARTALTSAIRVPAGRVHASPEVTVLNARTHLLLCELLDGQLPAAATHACKVIQEANGRGMSALLQVRPAYIALAWASVLRGQLQDVEATLAAGLAADVGGQEPLMTWLLHLAQARAAILGQRPQAARLALAAAARALGTGHPPRCLAWEPMRLALEVAVLSGEQPDLPPDARAADGPPSTLSEYAVRARYLLATGNDTAVDQLLAAVEAEAAQPGTFVDRYAAVELFLVRALLADHRRQDLQATRSMQEAVRLASESAVVYPFLVTGSARTSALLARVRDINGADTFVSGLLRRLSAVSPQTPGTSEPMPLVDPLTERELTMLALLPTVRTNAEIAADLFVSVNTVKSHLQHLYRKLDVASRREAVTRARELRLLL